MKISPARAAAFEILALVGSGSGHSDELLCGTGSGAQMEALSPEDRNLTTALVMGVLRWQIALDAQMAKLLARPGQRLAEPVAVALRMGAFQLLHMDRIPVHAALNESVEMCRAAGQPHATGMVNAILRRLAAEQASLNKQDLTQPASQSRDMGRPLHEPVAMLAQRLGHPLWLVKRWVDVYGREAALAICEYNQQEPRRGAIFTKAHDTIFDQADELIPQMDDGSRLVAEIAAATMPLVAGRKACVWDCCAAPGGKALILALRLTDAEILATDVSAKRLTQMRARLRQYGYGERITCELADAAAAHLEIPPEIQFDLILCDVPCSGTGTLARNPEIRLRLKPEDLVRQSVRQRAILTGAMRRLAPGGRLVYSTCSLEREENEQVVDAVANGAGVQRISMESLLAKLADSGVLGQKVSASLMDTAVKNGALRTLPGTHGCDGFFAAVLARE